MSENTISESNLVEGCHPCSDSSDYLREIPKDELESTKQLLSNAVNIIEAALISEPSMYRTHPKYFTNPPENKINISKELAKLLSGDTKVSIEVLHLAGSIVEFNKEPGGQYAKFARCEIPYLLKLNKTNKEQIDYIYPVLHQAFVAMNVEGHSGSTYRNHASVFDRALVLAQEEVQKRQLPFSNSAAITWEELEQFEIEATGCKNKLDRYAFSLAFKSKEYREFNYAQLQLIRDTLKACLLFKPLTELTLDDSEWADMSEFCHSPEDKEKSFQNRRCSSVFKLVYEDGSEFVYNLEDGPRFNDADPRSDLWFTSGGRNNLVKFDPKLPLGSQRYAIFMKWPDDQEPGTTPDDNWTEYNYIPALPEIPAIGTYLRRYNFQIRKVVGHVFEEGELVAIQVIHEQDAKALGANYVPETISVVDYNAVGQFNEYKYPHYSVFEPKWYMREKVEVEL